MLTEGAKLFPPVRTMQQDTPERLRETKSISEGEEKEILPTKGLGGTRENELYVRR